MPDSLVTLPKMLEHELVQLREEGRDPGPVAEEVKRALEGDLTLEYFDELYAKLAEAPAVEGYPYVEPSDLEGIRSERPEGPRTLSVSLSEEELYNRIYGAWLGRCAGCNLGKPVEGWPREKIERYLRTADAYPLRNYFPVLDPFPEGLELNRNWPETTLGNVHCMARDDDIDYTIMGLNILETYGFDFTTEDVAQEWLSRLPYDRVFTAERITYRNLVNWISPSEAASHQNPYREWIGAQIRADAWGYVAPGKPEFAAELAFRDASLSHVKNGIYGEMFVAAMLAAASVTDDIEEVIRIGLTEIPARCRLAEAARDTLEAFHTYPTWQEAWDHLMKKYGEYHVVHTINNAVIVLLGLLYGKGELERTICIAVMGGFDTDCNGATAGSIIGMMLGANRLPDKWIAPLNDRIKSIVVGFTDSRISDLAKRTTALALSQM